MVTVGKVSIWGVKFFDDALEKWLSRLTSRTIESMGHVKVTSPGEQ